MVVSSLLILAFSERSISGYDMVFTGDGGGEGAWKKYLMLLIPLIGLLLLVGAFNSGNSILPRGFAECITTTYFALHIVSRPIN